MKVHWTISALENLRVLHQHIARHSPANAQDAVERLTRRSQQLGNSPDSGRIVSNDDMPELREIIEGKARLLYQIKPDQIDVIALLHVEHRLPWEKTKRRRSKRT